MADAIVYYQGSQPAVQNEKNIAILPIVFQKHSNHKPENSSVKLVDNDFFLLSADDLEQAVVFLKAYSQFKQWQKSNIQVLVHLPKAIRMLFHQKISNYAYREAIVVLEDGEQYQWALSHCFGHFVWQEKEIVNSAIKRGLLSNKPLFTNTEKNNQVMFEDCLGFFETNEKSIFSSMTQLYKETLPVKDWAESRKKFYANNATHFTLVEMEKLMQA